MKLSFADVLLLLASSGFAQQASSKAVLSWMFLSDSLRLSAFSALK
jgi:hypothetical protein